MGIGDWLIECQIANISSTTLEKYRIMSGNLLWFLNEKGLEQCGKREIQQFFLYLRNGHEDEQGRWGNGNNRRPVRSGTVATYFTVLRTLFRYLVRESLAEGSPLESMPKPVDRPDQIQPFTIKQLESLFIAAKSSRHPKRDEALLKFLLDTGVRASELCSLNVCDVEIGNRRCQVLGKGNKFRTVYFGKECTRVLWQYLKITKRPTDSLSPLFLASKWEGEESECAMTRSGLLQLLHRLGDAAGVTATRCSPHTFRHTFAITFLRNGGNTFTLQQLLGHTSLAMTTRYVSLAQADIENQHRQYSPVDGLKKSSAKAG